MGRSFGWGLRVNSHAHVLLTPISQQWHRRDVRIYSQWNTTSGSALEEQQNYERGAREVRPKLVRTARTNRAPPTVLRRQRTGTEAYSPCPCISWPLHLRVQGLTDQLWGQSTHNTVSLLPLSRPTLTVGTLALWNKAADNHFFPVARHLQLWLSSSGCPFHQQQTSLASWLVCAWCNFLGPRTGSLHSVHNGRGLLLTQCNSPFPVYAAFGGIFIITKCLFSLLELGWQGGRAFIL